MTTYYKLTDQDARGHNNTQWGEEVEHHVTGDGDLCGPGWIHVYTDPLLAILMNPIHADFKNARVWIGTGSGKTKSDNGLKIGVQCFRTEKQIPIPKLTILQRVRFAILCALEVYKGPEFKAWAGNWLSGDDRTWSAAIAMDEKVKERTWAGGAATQAVWAAIWASREADWVHKASAFAVAKAAEAAARAMELDLIKLAYKAKNEG